MSLKLLTDVHVRHIAKSLYYQRLRAIGEYQNNNGAWPLKVKLSDVGRRFALDGKTYVVIGCALRPGVRNCIVALNLATVTERRFSPTEVQHRFLDDVSLLPTDMVASMSDA